MASGGAGFMGEISGIICMLGANRSMHPAKHLKFYPVVQFWCLLGLAVCAVSLRAQDIIMSAPRAEAVPPFLRDQLPPAPASLPPTPAETPFKFGSFVLHPSLSYSYMNQEGLPSADGRRIASEVHTVSASLSADLGQHWSLNYSPTWVTYTARAMSDSFDQSASLSGATTVRDLGIHFTESYSNSKPTLIETGRQTQQESWGTSLSASYSFSPKVQFQASGNMNERNTDIATNTRAWSSSASLNLVFTPRISLNLGSTFGYTEIVDAPDTYNDGYNAQVSWRPADKLSFSLSTGRQYTHSNSSAGLDLSSPLLNFSLGYQPFETTSISLAAGRTVSPSYFKSQVTEGLQRSISLNQRLFGRFYFNASYGKSDTDYLATDTLATAGRKDSVKSYSAGLSTHLFGRLGVSASFSKTQNGSNDSGFSFSSKQYGLRLSYSF